MRKIYLVAFLLPFFIACNTENTTVEEVKEEVNEIKPDLNMNEDLLRHVVLVKFKEGTSQEDIAKVEEAFSALENQIPEIKDYEWGLNNSPEGLNDGLTHCFLVTFASEEDRAIYLPHPEHQAFVKILRPHLEKAVVVDYWANEK